MNTRIIENEEQRRERVLMAAWKLMSQKGIKAVTMDDITGELAMSKRTVYELLHDKAAIVRGLLMELNLPEKMKAQPRKGDSLDYLFEMMLKGWSAYRKISPLFFRDLENYYPEVAQEFALHVQLRHRKVFEELLAKGIKEGVFRSDLDVSIVAVILVESTAWMMHYQVFSESTILPDALLGQLYALLIYGVVAPAQVARVTQWFTREIK